MYRLHNASTVVLFCAHKKKSDDVIYENEWRVVEARRTHTGSQLISLAQKKLRTEGVRIGQEQSRLDVRELL